MSDIQIKLNRHERKENTTHNEKNQSIEKDPELIIELNRLTRTLKQLL